MGLLNACSLAGLKQVAFSSAMQGLWLGDRKVGSQVVMRQLIEIGLKIERIDFL